GCIGYNFQFTVVIYIPSSEGLYITNLGNFMSRPWFFFSGIFMPTKGLAKPATGNEIHSTIFINIHGDGAKVIMILAISGLLADAMSFSEDRPRISFI